MSSHNVNYDSAKIKQTANDLLDAIRLDDSVAGWPDHFDDDFHEAMGPDEALSMLEHIERLEAENAALRKAIADASAQWKDGAAELVRRLDAALAQF